MKLTFTGESLADIHFQIKQAAKELNDGISYPTDTHEIKGGSVRLEEVQPHVEAMQNSMINDQAFNPQAAFGQRDPIPTASISAADVDTEGIVYDPAIHTSTRAKTAKGTWKKKPGGAGVASGSVKSEPASQPANITSMERAATQQPAIEQPTTAAAIQHHENAGPAIGAAPSMHNFDSFKSNLMTVVVRLINEGKMDRAYMQELNQFFGVSNLWDVKNDDAKAKQLFDLFIQYQFIMGA